MSNRPKRRMMTPAAAARLQRTATRTHGGITPPRSAAARAQAAAVRNVADLSFYLDRAVQTLRGSAGRPRTSQALRNHLRTMFAHRLDESRQEALFALLRERGYIAIDASQRLTYCLDAPACARTGDSHAGHGDDHD